MNITLIGMPGSGKSFFGRKLAEFSDCKFIDIDEVIEGELNSGLQEIVSKYGEKRFLETEEQEVLDLKFSQADNYVVSTGGSVVYSKKAMNFLKKNSLIVFLNADFVLFESQILNRPKRGIIWLKSKNLKELYRERLPLYKKYADIVIKISENFKTNEVVDDIIQRIKDSPT